MELLFTAYPNVKIKDANSMTTMWEMTLGSYSAESVYKAARLHISQSKFFPTPAEIREKMIRAEMMYQESDIELNKLTSGQEKKIYTYTQVDGSTLTFTEEELEEWLDRLTESQKEY